MNVVEEEEAQRIRPQNATTLNVVEDHRGLILAEPIVVNESNTKSKTTSDANYNDDKSSVPAAKLQEDSNEALEDTQHSIVVEPEDTKERESESETAAARSGEISPVGQEPAGLDYVDDDKDGDEIERRLFVESGKKISDELKRFREQRAKRFSRKQKHRRKRNRKRRRQISNKHLVKMTQTRQSSSSTQAYDGTASLPVTDASLITLNHQQQQHPNNQLTSSLKNHRPNPMNLSSAVQRLIMSKLGTGTNNNNHQHQQQLRAGQKFANEQQSSSTSAIVINPMPNVEFLQPAEEYRGDNQATKKYPHHQLHQPDLFADNFGQPHASSAFGASTTIGDGNDVSTFHAGRLSSSTSAGNSRQVVPIEIIGLDPAVTNSIIYGSDNGESELPLDSGHSHYASNLAAATSGENTDQQSGASNLQQTRGSRNTMNQPSILHIHHFHPLAGGNSKQQMADATAAVAAAATSAGHGGEGELAEQQQLSEVSQQQQQLQQTGQAGDETNGGAEQINETTRDQREANQWHGAEQKFQNQQLFVTNKGELVYLAVQDKTGDGVHESVAGHSGESVDPSEPQTQENTVGDAHVQDQLTAERPNNDSSEHQFIPAGYQQQVIIMQHPNGSRSIVPIKQANNGNQQSNETGEEDTNNSASAGQTMPVNMAKPTTNGSQLQNQANKMIMVSYRPSNMRQTVQGNGTQVQVPMRGAYNDGQESTHMLSEQKQAAPNLMQHSAQNYGEKSTSPQGDFHNSTEANSHLLDRLWKQINTTSIQQRPSAQMVQPPGSSYTSPASNSGPPLMGPLSFHLHTRPLLVEDVAAAGGSSLVDVNDLRTSAPDWSRFRPSSLAGGAFRGPIPSNHSHPYSVGIHQNMIDSSALFEPIMVARPNSAVAAAATLPGNSSSANLLTNSELLNLFRELKRPTSNSSSHSLVQANLIDAAAAASAASTKLGGFELTQASNQSPPKYLKNQQNQTLFPVVANSIHNKKPPSKLNTDTITPSSNLPTPIVNTYRPNLASTSGGDSTADNSGVSNLAMAFISVISLVTLALIAGKYMIVCILLIDVSRSKKSLTDYRHCRSVASLIYRYRRRSMGRCSNLAGRSRLNLTQRTKHFVRSNFVNPNDVSSIKSINLSAGSSTLKTSTGTESTISGESGKGGRGESRVHNQPLNVDRYTTTKSFGNGNGNGVVGLGKCLSTFNANSMATDAKYHGHHHHEQEPATDIKTLNTRAQKQSYLKSLISAPTADTNKTKRSSGGTTDAAAASADSNYLNIKQRYSGGGGGASAGHVNQNYGLSLVARMSAINSMDDGDPLHTKAKARMQHTTCSATVSPNQHRKQTSASGFKPPSHNNNCKLAPDIDGTKNRL